MARELPSIGAVTYNGFTFPEAFTCKIRSVPIYDSADRARKYIEYTITIEAIILPDDAPTATAGAQTDANVLNIRKRLESPYKPLSFTDQGFGDIVVDGALVVDSRFGPKPRLLAWESVGSNRACRVVWVCEVTIPECSSGTPSYHHALAEFTYQTSWTINESGMTVRTMRATIEVPISIIGGVVQDTIDDYRNRFNPPALPGFWRSRHYDESRGKNILEIVIIDTEVPSDNPLFPGCIRADVTHRTTSSLDMGFVNWSNVISGTIEAVPGFPRGQLWALFSALVQQRKALGEGHVVNMKGFAAANQKSRTILHRISVEESVFSRNLSFEMAWNTYACGAQFFLQRNGLFKPVLTNWNQWQTGLGEVLGIRGIAGLKTNKNDDIIIDLCTSNSSPGDNNAIKPALAEDVTLFSNQCPASADQSFLSMNVNFGIEYDNNTVQHRKLQETSLDRYRISQANPNPADSGFYPSEANDSMSISPSEEHKIQMRGYQTARLIFSGKMTRICYKPIMPKVVSIGGKPAIQRGKPKFHVYVETISDTTPIYGATWYIEYNLNSIPEGEFFDTIQTNIKPEAFANATILTSRPQ